MNISALFIRRLKIGHLLLKKRELILIKKLANHSFFRFLVVGVINTVFSYSMFSLFIFLKFHYVLAALFSTILGILFNFHTIGKLVFKNFQHSLIGKFFMVYGFLYLLNILFLRLLKDITHNHYLSGFIILFPLAMLSYILNKKFVFNKWRQPQLEKILFLI